jgi:cell wall-associated NlpC family hydrolase
VRERGQISVAAVAAITVVLLGGVLIGYLSMLAAGGGHAQRAADLAAIAAAGRLGANPDASSADLRRVAAVAAAANGGRVVSVRVVRTGPVPRAVDVAVAVAVDGSVPVAGRQHRRVVARARAGVAFSATLPEGRFRPVDLHGGRGPLAAVAAAEAQVGWPYQWGGESREDGGFDCSGLVDYAYAAAGDPLPGRPTAADLWQMARPETAAELAPADLVFVGSSGGAPHHVGMYVGDGMVVVAPHTGASVRYEPLAAGGWDGFARMLPAQPGPPMADAAITAAARAHQVPADAIAAELHLGLAADPDAAATALRAAMRRHPGDLAAALADALHDPSAAALVLRSASGPALGDGFGAAVRLLPTPPPPSPRRTRPEARSHGGGLSVSGVVATAAGGVQRAAGQLDELGGKVSLQALEGLRNLLRFGVSGIAAFIPDPHLRDVAQFMTVVWDTVAFLRSGVEISGWSLWAARLGVPVGFAFGLSYLWQAYTARRRSDRVWYGLQAAGNILMSVGVATAGADLLGAGVASLEIPPVGVALIVTGGLLLAGACAYREWGWLTGGGALSEARTGVRWARAKATRAAGAVVDAGRSLVDALNPF